MKPRVASRAAGNRRLSNGKGHRLLDVKVRTVTAKRQRRQRINGLFWKVALLAAIGWAGWLGISTALDKFFLSNPEYTLRRVTLELDGIMSREDAIETSGLHEGENIFRINLTDVEQAFRGIPQVSAVSVERRLPDEISVKLVSRMPVAWVAPPVRDADPFDPEKSLLVDGTGLLMRPRMVNPEYYHLPIVYGVRSDNIQDGEPLHNEDLRQALSLMTEINDHPEYLLRVRSINIEKGYCFDVTSDRNARITFGPDNFPAQLERLRELLQYCRDTGRELESVNLMVKRNTPVRFAQANVPAAQLADASEEPKPRRH